MNKFGLNSMRWSWKELLQLLFLTLVIVPFLVEFLLQNALYVLFQNSLYSGTLTGLVMAIVFVLGVYFIALKPHGLSWNAVGLHSFSKEYWKSILYCIVILAIGSVLILGIMGWFNVGWENKKTQSLQDHMTFFTFLVGFLSAAVISPLYEEIFYRGFLYKWFRVKWGIGAAVMISSLIFTIVHIPTYNTLPVNFFTGIVLSWVYEKSGSIWPGIIIHGTVNGLAVILTAFS
ncbi:type II CAAX endopeptidase family protein [Bacillus sp. B190/17]|uniref:Type II CAAX endopeptidase family protein n=1 Tax=Bacillus lumedeiriae TaxID=3058829 RepID=A0ABW8I8Y5_9BACI